MKKYILNYCNFDEGDYELYQTTMGIYSTLEKAKQAMEDEFLNDFEDGDETDGLDVFKHTETEIYCCYQDSKTDRYNINEIEL